MNVVTEPLWVPERDVTALIDLADAIDAVEGGLRAEAAGEARTMEKTHVAWGGAHAGGGHTLHAIGAEMAGAGVVGTKTWAHTAGGATPLLVVWDADSGRLLGIVEAFVLGQLRTAAVSGVATRWLAGAGADVLAIIGTGKQALPQVAAVAHVRELRAVRVFSPNADHRAAFASRVADLGFGFDISVEQSVAAAVDGATIVTTATRAREPFLTAAMLAPGAHVNAIGAITPERQELDGDIAARASVVVADSPDAARRLSREVEAAKDVRALSEIVAGGSQCAAAAGDDALSLFKAMGIGLADLALGAEVLRRADAAGAGRPIPHPEKAQPRLARPAASVHQEERQ